MKTRKVVFLDGDAITDIDALHDAFVQDLELDKKYDGKYGRNLDALNDVLTEYNGSLGVIAVNTEKLHKAVGRRWKSFLRLMNTAEQEIDDFKFILDPFSDEEKKN